MLYRVGPQIAELREIGFPTEKAMQKFCEKNNISLLPDEIEIYPVCLQPFELFSKYSFIIRISANVEFSCKIEAVARVLFHALAYTPFRISVVVDIRCIKIVDAGLIRPVHDRVCSRIIDGRTRLSGFEGRQTHVSQAEP